MFWTVNDNININVKYAYPVLYSVWSETHQIFISICWSFLFSNLVTVFADSAGWPSSSDRLCHLIDWLGSRGLFVWCMKVTGGGVILASVWRLIWSTIRLRQEIKWINCSTYLDFSIKILFNSFNKVHCKKMSFLQKKHWQL